MPALLSMHGISKIYPGVVANDRVELEVLEGEIHALLGENGAGKTTLVNILYGLSAPDGGTIRWRGEPVRVHSPSHATRLGIGMVHQHFMLVPRFSGLQNVILGAGSERGVWLDLEQAGRRVRALADQYGLEVDLDAQVQDMALGTRQRLEILKALYRGAQLLILDEPTAVLTPAEVEALFVVLRRLAAQGHATIFISHKLEEVLAISDRVTVLRDGRNVATLPTAQATKPGLAQMMVGRPVVLEVQKSPARQTGRRVIEIEEVWVEREHGRDRLDGVSLYVEAGEIVGVAGIDGNGQGALLEILCGLNRPSRGRVTVLGEDVTGASPRRVAALNIGRIPEDRASMGLLPPLSVKENLILGSYARPPLSRRGVLSGRRIGEFARRLVAEFDVRTPGVELAVENLSGGNQQKVILARELHHDPQVLIVANATRGLDVGATEYTYRRVLEGRDRGAGVLLISSDLEEVLYLSDRIAIMHAGRIMGVVPAEAADRTRLGLMMTGTPHSQLEGG
jgi:simple sugar transport system ATP-binding protein